MSLFSVLSVSASGMAAQRTRAELLVQNLANSETTRTPEGGPYRRRDVVFQSAPVDVAVFRGLSERNDERGRREWKWPMWSKTPPKERSGTSLDIPTRIKTVTWLIPM